MTTTQQVSEREQLGQFIPPHYHGQMLANVERMEAFKSSIHAVVRPGYKVLELGGGTGVLSFFALQCGAEVTCVDANPEMIETARLLLRQNPGGERVQLVLADAMTYIPEAPVDVVICEMLHSALLREQQLLVLDAFRHHHLQRFGKLPIFLPDTTLLAVQPVQQNFDFMGFHAPIPLFQQASLPQPDTIGLGDPVIYGVIEYQEAQSLLLRADFVFQAHAEGELNALRFITKNLVAIVAQEQRSIDWHCHYLVLPLSQPVHLNAGDRLRLRFHYLAGGSIHQLQQALLIQKLPQGDINHLFNGQITDLNTARQAHA